jgi:hypothetical protein
VKVVMMIDDSTVPQGQGREMDGDEGKNLAGALVLLTWAWDWGWGWGWAGKYLQAALCPHTYLAT